MFRIIWIIIHVLAAYWVFNDAKGRGHDFGHTIMWTTGTLVIPFLFLPLYLVFGRKLKLPRREEPVIDIESVPADQLMHCSMCGKQVQNDFKTCPYCSHTLNPKCEQCGRELNREWRMCPYCETQATPK